MCTFNESLAASEQINAHTRILSLLIWTDPSPSPEDVWRALKGPCVKRLSGGASVLIAMIRTFVGCLLLGLRIL